MRLLNMAIALLIGCGGAVSAPLSGDAGADAHTVSGLCDPPDFTLSNCFPVISAIRCVLPDATMWDHFPSGELIHFQFGGTECIIKLCDIAPDGHVLWSEPPGAPQCP